MDERDRNMASTRSALVKSFDADHDERVDAPYRRGAPDHRISDNFSTKMIGKREAPSHHGQMLKNLRTFEEKTAEVVPKQKWQQEVIPSTKNMPLRVLLFPYSPGTAFWLEIGETATKVQSEIFTRKTMTEVYKKFQTMAPALTFKPSSRDLKCKGSYTHSYSSCTWEAQIWRVDPDVARSKSPKNEFIFECRRKSKGGQEAFMSLVFIIGAFLKELGRAKFFANGCEIFGPISPVENLGKLAIPGLGSSLDDLSMIPMSDPRSSMVLDMDCPITLDTDCVAQMTEGIAERRHPQCSENMAILAQCVVNIKNREVLHKSDELGKAIQKELMKGTDLTTCINALTLIEHAAISPKEALPAVAQSLMVHSGYKDSGYKGIRSRAVESTALRVMAKLACNIGEDREKTLLEIENKLRGKLVDEVFNKVQDIRTCRRTVNVF